MTERAPPRPTPRPPPGVTIGRAVDGPTSSILTTARAPIGGRGVTAAAADAGRDKGGQQKEETRDHPDAIHVTLKKNSAWLTPSTSGFPPWSCFLERT
jgi:hypothetical protein